MLLKGFCPGPSSRFRLKKAASPWRAKGTRPLIAYFFQSSANWVTFWFLDFFYKISLRRAGWGGGPTFEPDFDRAGPRLGSRSP